MEYLPNDNRGKCQRIGGKYLLLTQLLVVRVRLAMSFQLSHGS